jgi:hypothetical protein
MRVVAGRLFDSPCRPQGDRTAGTAESVCDAAYYQRPKAGSAAQTTKIPRGSRTASDRRGTAIANMAVAVRSTRWAATLLGVSHAAAIERGLSQNPSKPISQIAPESAPFRRSIGCHGRRCDRDTRRAGISLAPVRRTFAAGTSLTDELPTPTRCEVLAPQSGSTTKRGVPNGNQP